MPTQQKEFWQDGEWEQKQIVIQRDAQIKRLKGQVAELTAKLAERDKAITDAVDREEWCPFCGATILPKYDCKNCSVDHLGSECYRSGAHQDECIVVAIGKSALAASGEGEDDHD
jgi:hypothetical protein